jgi:hypothetical protein
MGQILHGSATKTHAIRTAIQRSKAPLKQLAAQYGLTVAKWPQTGLRQRRSDGSEGPALDHPVTQGRHLPQARCLPQIAGGKTSKKPFNRYPTVELPRELMAGAAAKAIRLVLSHFGPTGGCNSVIKLQQALQLCKTRSRN